MSFDKVWCDICIASSIRSTS